MTKCLAETVDNTNQMPLLYEGQPCIAVGVGRFFCIEKGTINAGKPPSKCQSI